MGIVGSGSTHRRIIQHRPVGATIAPCGYGFFTHCGLEPGGIRPATGWEMDYKRLLARKRTSIPATIEAKGVCQDGAIRDVSMHGAFVASEHPLAVGTKILLRSEYMMINTPFEIKGEVVDRRQNGNGIRFQCETDHQKQWLSFLFR